MTAIRKAMLSRLENLHLFCYNAVDRMQALLLRPISTFSCISGWQAEAGFFPRAILMTARDRP